MQLIAWVLLDQASIPGSIHCGLGQGHMVQRGCLGPPFTRAVAGRTDPKRQEEDRHLDLSTTENGFPQGPDPLPSSLPRLTPCCLALSHTDTSQESLKRPPGDCSLGQKGLAINLWVHPLGRMQGRVSERESLKGRHQDTISLLT